MKRQSISLLAALLCVTAMASNGAPAGGHNEVKDVFEPLPVGSIRLTNYLDDDIRNSMDHWSKETVPFKQLIDFYRTGRPGGKFALGEMAGKTIRANSLFYNYTADEELLRITKEGVYDLLSTAQPNGNISCTPVEDQPGKRDGDIWERKYTLLGLIQYYQSMEQDPVVLEAIVRIADIVLDQIGPAPKVGIYETGWTRTNIESASILEPMVKVYLLTGDTKYLDFAKYIIESGGCRGADFFREVIDGKPLHQTGAGYPKAYEMTSVFEGLAQYYRATGDEYSKTALDAYFKAVKDNEITIIGNGGADQPYWPKWMGEAWDHTRYEQANPNIKRMMETCVGVTWIKFCSEMLRLTGDPSAVDYIEKYIYNGLLGAMRHDGCGFSYVNLLNGRKVTNSGWGTVIDGQPVTCCNLSGPIGLGHIPVVAVMQASEGPVVNLYNACEATARTAAGREVKLTLSTEFPRDNEVNISVLPKRKEKFSVLLRIPSWSEATVVKVNGKPVQGVQAGTYLTIARRWKKGDLVTVTLDMRARLLDAPKGDDPNATYDFQAVQYGPIVLARDENTDPDFDKPVQVVADAAGEVAVRKAAPSLKTTRMEFVVPTTTGEIRMIDYSSVDGWEGKRVQTWLPVLR